MNPRQSVEAVREAARLWQDETRVGSVVAVVLVLVFVGWPLYRFYRASPAGGER
jgi:hypothetical protein